MKDLLLKMVCFFAGHKWVISYDYFNGKDYHVALICKRCWIGKSNTYQREIIKGDK